MSVGSPPKRTADKARRSSKRWPFPGAASCRKSRPPASASRCARRRHRPECGSARPGRRAAAPAAAPRAGRAPPPSFARAQVGLERLVELEHGSRQQSCSEAKARHSSPRARVEYCLNLPVRVAARPPHASNSRANQRSSGASVRVACRRLLVFVVYCGRRAPELAPGSRPVRTVSERPLRRSAATRSRAQGGASPSAPGDGGCVIGSASRPRGTIPADAPAPSTTTDPLALCRVHESPVA
jgi:hypothetical protein